MHCIYNHKGTLVLCAQVLTLSSSFHLVVFYNILSGLFVCQPVCLTCKHAARLADSNPNGAHTDMHMRACAHTCTTPSRRIDEKWPLPVPYFIFIEFLLLMHALCMCTCQLCQSIMSNMCVWIRVCAHTCAGSVKNDACHPAKWEVVAEGALPCQDGLGPAVNPTSQDGLPGPLGALNRSLVHKSAVT